MEWALKAHLQEGLDKVRAVLGPSVLVSDKDIQDSLWHYYYDVDKTVNYLLRKRAPGHFLILLTAVEQQAPAQLKKSVKKNKGSLNGLPAGESKFSFPFLSGKQFTVAYQQISLSSRWQKVQSLDMSESRGIFCEG